MSTAIYFTCEGGVCCYYYLNRAAFPLPFPHAKSSWLHIPSGPRGTSALTRHRAVLVLPRSTRSIFRFGVLLCRNSGTQPICLHGLTLLAEDRSQILFSVCFPFQTPALPPRSSTIAKPKDSPPVPPKQR